MSGDAPEGEQAPPRGSFRGSFSPAGKAPTAAPQQQILADVAAADIPSDAPWLVSQEMSHAPRGSFLQAPAKTPSEGGTSGPPISAEPAEPTDPPTNLPADPADPPDDPWSDRRSRLRNLLQRALSWEQAIREGSAANRAEIAQVEGITRARVSQVMRLLDLAEEIQKEILDEARTGPIPTERQLRQLARVRPHDLQLVRYRRLVAELDPPRVTAWKGRPRPESRARRQGFQHLFDQARRYQRLLDSGDHLTLESIGRAVGVTGTRVGQVLNLLHLAPEIIEALDVPAEQAPQGITTGAIRALARLREHGEQLARFERMLVEGWGASVVSGLTPGRPDESTHDNRWPAHQAI